MNRELPTILLAIDVGNTAIKIGSFAWPCPARVPEPIDVLRLETHSPDLDQLHRWLPSQPTLCHLTRVHRPAADQLQQALRREPHIVDVHTLTGTDFPLPIDVCWPERVGHDRLAAAVAVGRSKPTDRSAILVDAGSAITVDAVSREGEFLGGAILPGLQIATTALSNATDRLPFVEVQATDTAPHVLGRSTEEAIRSGVFWGAVGAIRQLTERLRSHLQNERGTASALYVTGGAARPSDRSPGGRCPVPATSGAVRHCDCRQPATSAPNSAAEGPRSPMTPACSTRVAQLTPPGRGAIASVLIRGPGAVDCVDRLFRPHARIDWRRAPIGRVLVGRWQRPVSAVTSGSDRSIAEELVVCRTDADRVEVHCHGGAAAVSAVIDSLRQLGCQEIAWQELLGSPEETPIRRAARRALATARTQRVAAILLDQFDGAWTKHFSEFRSPWNGRNHRSPHSSSTICCDTKPLARGSRPPFELPSRGPRMSAKAA